MRILGAMIVSDGLGAKTDKDWICTHSTQLCAKECKDAPNKEWMTSDAKGTGTKVVTHDEMNTFIWSTVADAKSVWCKIKIHNLFQIII
jgi:hypothetical protein